MKKIASVAGWMAALMVACCPCTAEMSVQDGHVYGQKEIDGKRIVYDFDVPEEVESVKQYRTEAVRMKPEWVEQILKPYVQKPRSGDAWDLINDRQWNDTNFCYFEQNGRYACEGGSYIGPRKKTDDRDIQAASDVVLALLKEMNLSDFEYPFYTATSQCKSIETAIEPISSEEEYIRVKGLPDSSIREYYEKEALGKERNLIVVRFLMDDIPLCISNTQPHEKKGDLDEVVGSAGIFVLNENNEIIRAQIRKYVHAVGETGERQKVLPWRACIDEMALGVIRGEEVTITEVELNLVAGNDGITYPIWRFSGYSDLRKLREENPEISINSSDFSCCVDACSGQCLYY